MCRLRNLARLGCLNLQTVDELALAEVFLPRLLPQQWRGQAFIARADADSGPKPEWLSILWRKLKAWPHPCACIGSLLSMVTSCTSFQCPLVVGLGNLAFDEEDMKALTDDKRCTG